MSCFKTQLSLGTALCLVLGAGQAWAQDAALESRIQDLEKELILLKRQLESQVQQAQEEAAAARAQAEEVAGPRLKMKGPRPTLESADGRYSIGLRGRIHFDAVAFDVDGGSPIGDLNSGTNFRRARLGVGGKIDGDFRYRIAYDAGGSSISGTSAGIDVAYLQYRGFKPLKLTIGKHKVPSNFEEQTSSNNINFMERSLATNLATGPAAGKRPAVSAIANTDFLYVGGAISFDDEGTATLDEGPALNGRIAVFPINNDEMTVHLGVNGWYTPDPAGRIRFRDRPEIRVDGTRFIDASSTSGTDGAGNVLRPEDAFNVGLEAAGAFGPFWAQAEYNMFGFRPTSNGVTQPADVSFDAYYVQAGFIVTGERKRYSKSNAAWGGVKPKDNFNMDAGHFGALEVAARYSKADLDDGTVLGGEETNFTIGVNWYLNPNIRILFNWVMADVDRRDSTGVQLGDDFNAFGVRFQVNW